MSAADNGRHFKAMQKASTSLNVCHFVLGQCLCTGSHKRLKNYKNAEFDDFSPTFFYKITLNSDVSKIMVFDEFPLLCYMD